MATFSIRNAMEFLQHVPVHPFYWSLLRKPVACVFIFILNPSPLDLRIRKLRRRARSRRSSYTSRPSDHFCIFSHSAPLPRASRLFHIPLLRFKGRFCASCVCTCVLTYSLAPLLACSTAVAGIHSPPASHVTVIPLCLSLPPSASSPVSMVSCLYIYR